MNDIKFNYSQHQHTVIQAIEKIQRRHMKQKWVGRIAGREEKKYMYLSFPSVFFDVKNVEELELTGNHKFVRL